MGIMRQIGRSMKNLPGFVRELARIPLAIQEGRQFLSANPLTIGGLYADTWDVKIWSHATSPPPVDQDDLVLIKQMAGIYVVEVGDFCFTGDGGIYACTDDTAGALVWESLGSASTGVLGLDANIVTVAASRDIVASDRGAILEVTATVALNCPDGVGANWQMVVVSIGGTTTITADTTLQYLDGGVQVAANGLEVVTQCSLYHRGVDVWLALGDVEAIP